MQVKSYKSGSVGTVDLDETSFGGKVLYRTLKEAVIMYQANQRQGTVKTKGRSEVKGTNKKPYRQKHTGRARAGDVKSPIWRGGGTVFGPRPRSYNFYMPKKARRVALRSALAGKLADNELVVADFDGITAPSAKAARKILADLGAPRRALVILSERNENVYKSFRNFPGVVIRLAAELCAYDVVAGGLLIAERTAMDQLADKFAKTAIASEAGVTEAGATEAANDGGAA